MQLVSCEAPRVFPPWVACVAGRLIDFHHTQHFAAGRECAARALARLDVQAASAPIARGPIREPLWPDGFTGSITHTADYVAAAVARTSDARSIGLDAQEIVEPERAARLWERIVSPEEAHVAAGDLPSHLRFSLLFSVKEATFKCLYPLVRRKFYFDALSVGALDVSSGIFQARLTTTLSEEFAAGTGLSGRIAMDGHRVYAGIWARPMSHVSEK